jgi:hypothetical protein
VCCTECVCVWGGGGAAGGPTGTGTFKVGSLQQSLYELTQCCCCHELGLVWVCCG